INPQLDHPAPIKFVRLASFVPRAPALGRRRDTSLANQCQYEIFARRLATYSFSFVFLLFLIPFT
ncbi:MAG: hypothetical protein WA886_02410, partial [Candidatus Acidiferrales bacterium]